MEAIRAYIAEDSPRVAELVVGRIVKAVAAGGVSRIGSQGARTQ
ncbi:hypothetical protein [Nitrospira sp. Ecomares 2.1]